MKTTLPKPNMKPNLEIEDNGCFDCEKVECTYMVKDEVWSEAWPTYAEDHQGRDEEIRAKYFRIGAPDEVMWKLETHGRLFLCVACLETRLGRQLALEDFTPMGKAPCNRAIFLAAHFGAHFPPEDEKK